MGTQLQLTGSLFLAVGTATGLTANTPGRNAD
jgi:hypothetical protein